MRADQTQREARECRFCPPVKTGRWAMRRQMLSAVERRNHEKREHPAEYAAAERKT